MLSFLIHRSQCLNTNMGTELNIQFTEFYIITLKISTLKELELNKKINEEIAHIREEKQVSNPHNFGSQLMFQQPVARWEADMG